MKEWINHIRNQADYRHPIGLAVFRIIFGMVSFIAALRFLLKGWLHEFYIDPSFFFKYWGFEWVHAAPPVVLCALYALMMLCTLGITLGFYYRASAIGYFILFTYFELLDKTYYLNHYYFVSIIAFLLIFIPAHRYWSLDCRLRGMRPSLVRNWHVNIFRLQLGIVYFYAGISKINIEWIADAMPMRIWLQEFYTVPVIGPLFSVPLVAYVFSWFGLLYDCSIPFLLSSKITRSWAYLAVIIFHIATSLLFPIGMFPLIMMGATLIFFPNSFFKKVARKFTSRREVKLQYRRPAQQPAISMLFMGVLAGHFLLQLIFPFRYLLYPGHLFWHEQGFRFSWRVMLMEKSGIAEFKVRDNSGREWHISNCKFLTPAQEKMMATQPDFICQYAQLLKNHFEKQGHTGLSVHGDIFVSLNGRRSARFVDPATDLASVRDTWKNKYWILPSPQADKPLERAERK